MSNLPLITKIQYKNFEPGEFTNRKESTYEQTLGIIANFPWESQRDHLQVGPTSPSVTIEGNNGDFLKLAPYYEGKFVLYYLKSEDQLFTKSFADYKEAYPYIKNLFSSSPFDTSDFKIEHLWLQGKLIHFKGNDFHYVLNQPKFLFSIGLNGIIFFALLILMIAQIFYIPQSPIRILIALILFIPVIVFGRMLSLLLNHYRFSKDKLLIISKGNDIFSYGSTEDLQKFNKKDIRELTVFRNSAGRQHNAYTRLTMNSGDYLFISDFLIGENLLTNKFPGKKAQFIRQFFPFIPAPTSSSSSTPS